MEETKTLPPASQPAHAPVVDVVTPGAAATTESKPEPVAVEPRPAADADGPKDKPEPPKQDKEAAKPKDTKPAAPKKPGNGVGMAIFATVIIVLGLAAMATYAYLQTQN